ncbi:MAG: DNA repair protein RadA, partial [Hyphomicrobiales bacterium]|nr:DNA repair protein RadA [Hyphomicrobiales bacterium]
MAKVATIFACQTCGAVHSKWSGRCDSCSEWNSITEEASGAPVSGAKGQTMPKGRAGNLVPLTGDSPQPPRTMTGIAEFDRVTGGGLVAGSGVLIGGDPGIGKSTLLLQAMAALANTGARVIYVSGEEAIDQVRLRAERLGVAQSDVLLLAETNVSDIIATMRDGGEPAVVVIDSIQTLWSPVIESAPGTVSQLRAGSEALIRYAKQSGASVLLVGHVTKDGQIAGPKVIEHMVDTVLYFEGDRGHQFRILRAVKNRFGPTDEIGVFEMSEKGLQEVDNPSRLLMGTRESTTPGSAVFAGMEGTRPLLMEVQALVSPSSLGTPRRAVVGWDSNRLAMVLAVLETRAGIAFGAHDVYL